MSLKTADAFTATTDHADEVFHAMQNPNAAKLSAPVAAVAEPEEVAGIRSGGGRGNSRGRGNPRGRNRGGARGSGGARTRPPKPDPNDKSTWGNPHEDGPPPEACMNHYRWGKSAYYCRAKSTCPWKSFANPPEDD